MPRLIRQLLEEAGVSEEGERTMGGLDVVGDVAILRLPDMTAGKKGLVGRLVLREVSNVRAVFEQEGGIEGELRLRRLKHLAGEKRTLTVHRENGCAFRVDVAKCYFSPRLSTERLRIAEESGKGEAVLNMFAGVGPFSIPIAKKAGARVTSWELNGYACELHVENDGLNRVGGLITVLEGDAAELAKRTRKKYDRILMPHPSMADKFLPSALRVAKRKARIHYYRHVAGRDEGEAASALKSELRELLPGRSKFAVRRVREVGPRWLEMAADVRLP